MNETPKSEGRNPKEARTPKPESVGHECNPGFPVCGLRISFGFRPSDFGVCNRSWSPPLSLSGRTLKRELQRLLLVLCTTGFVAANSALAAAPLTTVPVVTARDRIMVPVSVNGSNGLSFMLDTGFSSTMIHPDLPGPLNLRRVGEIDIIGIAGEEKAPTYEGAVFDIGGARYAPRRVAALTSDAGRRRRRDGIIGSGLFRQYVVEIDFARKQLALYWPSNFTYAGKGEVISLRFRRSSNTPLVAGTINATNGTVIRGEFEIDTGCDSGVCLGHEFIEANHLLDDSETRAGGKFGVGGRAQTRSGHLPQLQLGSTKIDKPQTDFFIEGSPVDPGLAGHIGIGVLNQFKVIFDYSRKQMILEKAATP
jgi:predicted aspartyl protease